MEHMDTGPILFTVFVLGALGWALLRPLFGGIRAGGMEGGDRVVAKRTITTVEEFKT